MHLIVFVVRHGETVAGQFDPSLSDEGRASARIAGRLIHSQGGGLDLILCSPLKRAQEHANFISAAAGGRIEVVESLEPEGDPSDVILRLSSLPAGARVALVGHMPLLQAFVSELISDHSPVRVEIGRGDVLCIEAGFDAGTFGGALLWHIPSRMMPRAV